MPRVETNKKLDVKYFKDLKNGQIGEIIKVNDEDEQYTLGWLIVKVYNEEIVQVLGCGKSQCNGTCWSNIEDNCLYEIRILEKGETIVV